MSNKKLGEIGRSMVLTPWIYEDPAVIGSEFQRIVDVDKAPAHFPEHKVLVFSPEDLRELVRRVWEEAQNAMGCDGAASVISDETVEGFIKREGL